MTGDSETHVTKLVGAPGAGKTTALLEFAEREAEEYGTPAGELLFLTFTRSARYEAAERIQEVYPDWDTDALEKRVKTLHGAAHVACLIEGVYDVRSRENLEAPGQLLIRRTNDADACYFEWFFKQEFPHIEYDASERDPIAELRDGEVTEVPPGNRLMALYDYVKSKDWPLEQYYRAPFDVELPPAEIPDVLEAWEAFKDHNDLLQDDDYVKLAVENEVPPPGSVLIIDEFQDLSPLQYKLYEQWRDHPSVDRVYIAGDPHQAIYGFRGADPVYFRETPADEIVRREESKRCPEAVIEAAKPIAAPVDEHDVSGVDAERADGYVDHLELPDAETLAQYVRIAVDTHDEVFLLARTNRQAAKIAYGLRQAGCPYLDLKPDGPLDRWDHPAPALLAALRAFDEGEALPIGVLEIFLQHVTDAPARHEATTRADEGVTLRAIDGVERDPVPFDVYRQWFPNIDSARALTTELTVEDWRRELLAGALTSDASHDPADVRVGTIHAAKGLEAPCVFVFPAYTRSQLERYQNGAEAEERRLYYVAMTRASETVYVAHDYHNGTEFPPLEHGVERAVVSSQQ